MKDHILRELLLNAIIPILSVLGFDLEQQEELLPTLTALFSVLFETFLMEIPYEVRDWRLSECYDHIIGEKNGGFYLLHLLN